MSWTEQNIAGRKNIVDLVNSISQLSQGIGNRKEATKSRRWNMFGDLANMGLDVWGTLSGRKYETGERLAGEAHENTQRILTSESNQELENLRALNDKKLEQYKQNLANAKTEDERKYWQDVIRPYETEQAELDRKSREAAAAASRPQQTINTGDDQEQIATAWANFLEMNRDIHPEWLIVDEQTGRESIIPPSDAIERWRGVMYKKYGMEAVDEFLSLLGVGDGLGAGAGGGMGGDQGVVPEEPKGTTVKEILPDIIGEVPTNFGAAAGTTFGEAYRMFVEPVQRMLGLIPPKAPTPAKDVLPPLKEKYYHPH